jgi:hypothetical protein
MTKARLIAGTDVPYVRASESDEAKIRRFIAMRSRENPDAAEKPFDIDSEQNRFRRMEAMLKAGYPELAEMFAQLERLREAWGDDQKRAVVTETQLMDDAKTGRKARPGREKGGRGRRMVQPEEVQAAFDSVLAIWPRDRPVRMTEVYQRIARKLPIKARTVRNYIGGKKKK